MENYDRVREDFRILLGYIIGGGEYSDLLADTENCATPGEAMLQFLDSYTDVKKHYINASSLRDNLSAFYYGARLDLQVQKNIRRFASDERLKTVLGTDNFKVIYGVASVLVNYYKACSVDDIINAYNNDAELAVQIDLAITAMEQLADKDVPLAVYSLMFIPNLSAKSLNADFVAKIISEHETIKKRALSMSREQSSAMSSCLFSILREEYETYKTECEGAYDIT